MDVGKAWLVVGFNVVASIALVVAVASSVDEITINQGVAVAFVSGGLTLVLSKALIARGSWLNTVGLVKPVVGWRRSLQYVGIAVVAYIVWAAIGYALVRLVQPEPDQQALAEEISQSGLAAILPILAAVVFAPFFEEIVFRGILFRSLRTQMTLWLSVVISATIFAILHDTLLAVVQTFGIGIILALLTEKTKSIYPAIGLHLLNNLVAVGILIATT